MDEARRYKRSKTRLSHHRMPESRSWYWLLLGAVVVLSLAYADRRDLIGLYHAFVESREEVHALEAQVDALEEEVASLEEEVTRLDDDPLEVEAASRQGKSLVRDGETVFHVVIPEPSAE